MPRSEINNADSPFLKRVLSSYTIDVRMNTNLNSDEFAFKTSLDAASKRGNSRRRGDRTGS
jgi:hypothetical protein